MVQEKGRAAHLSGLMLAVRKNRSKDAIGGGLTEDAWNGLAAFLEPRSIESQHVLIVQGATDRSLYFVESGMLRIYRSDHNNKRLQLAVLGPGSIVGEGTFFAPIARNASAEAVEPSVLWELKAEKFREMVRAQPGAACEVAMSLGAVLSVRTLSVAGRLAIT
jgi:CRP/FNR family transcriptional regulator, cyclic AMP receptor protein